MKPSYDNRHRVKARDGWPLTIYEYQPRGGARSTTPVLLCHGTNCRYRIFDVGDGWGLAPYLARRGIHVFAIDLRGRGRSLPDGMARRIHALMRRGWSVHDFIDSDLPRAFEFVLRHADVAALDYIGHSMGALIAFELLSSNRDARVRRVVSVAGGDALALLSPPDRAAQPDGEPPHLDIGRLLAPLARSAPYVPLEWGTRLAALSPQGLSPEWYATMLNPENVDRNALVHFMARSVVGVSSKKWRSLGALRKRAQESSTPPRDYHHRTLFLSGGGDRVVPPHRVQQTADRARHPDNKVVEFSRAQGYSADFGHLDLLIGKHAPAEVFPEIERWLVR